MSKTDSVELIPEESIEDLKAERDKWKAFSRKHEEAAKKNAEAASELAELKAKDNALLDAKGEPTGWYGHGMGTKLPKATVFLDDSLAVAVWEDRRWELWTTENGELNVKLRNGHDVSGLLLSG